MLNCSRHSNKYLVLYEFSLREQHDFHQSWNVQMQFKPDLKFFHFESVGVEEEKNHRSR